MTPEKTIKPVVYLGLISNDELLLVDYKTAPNPEKKGWWIPAPELAYGEDPKEKAAAIAQSFGFEDAQVELKDVESFVLPGGWHLIYHFTARVDRKVLKTPADVQTCKWVSSETLQQTKDLAHGPWERRTGLSYLSRNS